MSNTAETNLRQSEAKVAVVGILAEKDMKIETKEDGNSVLSGTIVLKIDEFNSVRFGVYANALTKDKNPNSVFVGLKTVMDEYKSIAEVGEEAADRIAVTKGDINLFTGKDGKTNVGFKSNFFNRIKKIENFEPRAEFSVEMYISGMVNEIDKEQNETGRLLVKGWVPTYNGIEPITLIAPDDVASAVSDSFEPGQTVAFYGEIINNKIEIRREIPVKIGKPRVEVETKYKNELLITGASEAYEEGVTKEKPYDTATIKAAIQERENKLEEAKNKANNAQPAPAAKPSGAARNRTLGF